MPLAKIFMNDNNNETNVVSSQTTLFSQLKKTNFMRELFNFFNKIIQAEHFKNTIFFLN